MFVFSNENTSQETRSRQIVELRVKKNGLMGESEGSFTGLVFREGMRLEEEKESKGVEGNFKAQK